MYDIGEKLALRAPGALSFRIADGVDWSSRTLSEVKSVANLSFTSQLRDFVAIAKDQGLTFVLYVPRNTTLSKPLWKAVHDGDIKLEFIPESLMANADWFRQTEWTARAAGEFFERLRRSRNKPQHLKIQAYTLQKAGHHEAALELANYFFEHHPDRMWVSSMRLFKALALAALGRHDAAVEEFRLAVQAERDFPNVRSDCWLDFGEHVVRGHDQQLYGEILELFAEFQHHHGLVFPVQRFRFYAVQALI